MSSRAVQPDLLNGLSRLQRTFVLEKIMGANDKNAALAAGYSLSVAENTKEKVWKPKVRAEFQRLTEVFVLEVHQALLENSKLKGEMLRRRRQLLRLHADGLGLHASLDRTRILRACHGMSHTRSRLPNSLTVISESLPGGLSSTKNEVSWL
jgi:hypothetical protein